MKKISSALMVSLMLGMLVGQSAAARSPLESASPPSEDESNPLYFCKLGCAYSLCTSLAAEEDPSNSLYPSISLLRLSNVNLDSPLIAFVCFVIVSDEEKIAACADSCSKACTKDFKA